MVSSWLPRGSSWRDLLTAAAYGVEDFLFVYGDRPESGRRSDDLTVRKMLGEARNFAARHEAAEVGFTVGVTSTLRPLPAWKQDADFLLAQVSFSVDHLVRWREALDFGGQVFAGVMVVASAPMARKLGRDIPQLTVPEWVIERLDADPDAGIDIACDLVCAIRDSGAFDGVHLVPVRRYREVARRLEECL